MSTMARSSLPERKEARRWRGPQLRTRRRRLRKGLLLGLLAGVVAGTVGFSTPVLAGSGSVHCGVLVYGAIEDKYRQLDGAWGPLRCPVGVEGEAMHGGRWQPFQAGYIFFHPNGAIWAKAVWGDISVKWTEWGREAGPLGYPLTDETATPDGVGRFNHFQFGSIYCTCDRPNVGAHVVRGAIRDRWAALGWERSPLGYPTTDEYVVPGGWRSDFQRGSIEMINGQIVVRYAGSPSPVGADLAFTTRAGFDGSTGAIQFNIGNIGSTRADASMLRVILDGGTYANQNSYIGIPSLAPGESLAVRQSIAGIGPGSHHFLFTLDPYNQVFEGSEQNNAKSVYFTISLDGYVFIQTP